MDDKVALILASAVGEHMLEALRKAVSSTFPTAVAKGSESSRFGAPRREQYHTKGGVRDRT